MPPIGSPTIARYRARPPRSRRAALGALLFAAALAVPAAPALANWVPGTPVIGPSTAVQSLGGVDVAPDGTGALVAVVGDHIFVSRLVGGAWGPAEQVDAGLPGPSSQPVVSAANGGEVSVAFVSGGNLYATTRTSTGGGWGALQTVWGSGGASDPSVDLGVNSKGYLVFTAPGAGGHDVRAAYSKAGAAWQLIPAPLDHDPNADAGAGTNRPRVGTSADGNAIATWGEAGHVYTRRIVGTSPSTVSTDALDGLVVEGVQAVAADDPEVAVQDDDSYTGVTMRALFTINGATRERAIFRRLRGSRFEPPAPLDTAPFASGQGSGAARIAIGGIGQGIAVGTNDVTNLTQAMTLRADATPGPLQQIDTVAASTAPTFAVPVLGTPLKMAVAWQLTNGTAQPDVRVRYYDGTSFGTETVMSQPALGPTDARDGLEAGADDNGDIVFAFVQDVPNQGPAIMVATIDQPPGKFAPHWGPVWQRTDNPLLTWSSSRESWGLYYKVTVDGQDVGVGDTAHLRKRVRVPLAQGVHRWQVTAVDRLGQTFVAKAGTVRIDSVPPTARLTTSGKLQVGQSVRLLVAASDPAPPPPAGQPKPATSGVHEVLLDWGDHSKREKIKHGSQHAYAKAGTYTVRVTVLDRAGNRATVTKKLHVKPRPKPRRRARGRATGGGRSTGGRAAVV